jgi:hypothetical protein
MIKSHGTAVEVIVRSNFDMEMLTPRRIEEVIASHYNYALSPTFGNLSVFINGSKMSANYPTHEAVEKEEKVAIRYGGKYFVDGVFDLAKNDVAEDLRGVAIVVRGKTVFRWLFNQAPIYPSKITGFVRADHLIDIVTTTKTDFNKQTAIWRLFVSRVGGKFSEWLTVVGAKARLDPQVEMQAMVQLIEQDLREVFMDKEIQKLLVDPFLALVSKRSPITDSAGDVMGKVAEGTQQTTGTHGGPSAGKGVVTGGPFEGASVEEDPVGDTRISEPIRRIRGGVQINFSPNPSDCREAWVDYSLPAVSINSDHPAFAASVRMGAYHYHILNCVFGVLSEAKEEKDRPLVRQKLFEVWNQIQGR